MPAAERFMPGDMITLDEGGPHPKRGCFVSTLYAGSSTGIRVKKGTALVVHLSDLPNKVHPHHFIMMCLDRLQFGWIRGAHGWRLL